MVLNGLGCINQASPAFPGFSRISPPTDWFRPVLLPNSSTMTPSVGPWRPSMPMG
jgi:hypothetical protein